MMYPGVHSGISFCRYMYVLHSLHQWVLWRSTKWEGLCENCFLKGLFQQYAIICPFTDMVCVRSAQCCAATLCTCTCTPSVQVPHVPGINKVIFSVYKHDNENNNFRFFTTVHVYFYLFCVIFVSHVADFVSLKCEKSPRPLTLSIKP